MADFDTGAARQFIRTGFNHSIVYLLDCMPTVKIIPFLHGYLKATASYISDSYNGRSMTRVADCTSDDYRFSERPVQGHFLPLVVNLNFSKFYRHFRIDFYARQIASIAILIDAIVADLIGARVDVGICIYAISLVFGIAVTIIIDIFRAG